MLTSGSGSCAFGTQWVADGTTITAEIEPSARLYTISLSGDTNGVTLAGTTLAIPSDGSRDIAVVVTEVKLALDVAAAHGTATPAAGRTEWSWGDTIAASVAADASAGGVQYVCTGWTGTGSVPASGTETNVTFTMEENSTLTWNWRTENRISVSVSGAGSCSFGTQWVTDGATVTAEIAPSAHLYTISLSGDTNGVTLAGTTLTIPSDGSRDIAVVVTEVKLALDVAAAHGTATPAAGRTEWSWGDSITAFVLNPAPLNGVRSGCTGWTGTGSVPASGTETNVTFTIKEDSTLTWNWQTQNRIAVTVSGAVSCAFGTQWVADGTTVTAEIVPATHLYSITLSGDTNGVTLAGTTLTIPSDGPRDIAVTVTEMKLALDVATVHGTPTPAAGHTEWSWNDEVQACVAADAPADSVRYVCIGWTGTGSVPAIGTETNVTFAITENSTLAWNWRKENRIAVAVSGAGYCAFGTQWVTDGATVTAEIVPTTHLYTIVLSGDTNGVTLVGTMLTIPSDGPRDIAVTVTETKLALDVATAHGTPMPAAGRTEWAWNSEVAANVAADAPADGVRYVCIGWTGTGSVPANGTETNLTFAIEEDSTLTWNWRKENQIAVAVSGAGSCAFGTQWIADGETVVAEIVPSATFYKIDLVGDAEGVTLDGTTLTIPADRPHDVAVSVLGGEWNYVVFDGEVSIGGEFDWYDSTAIPQWVTGSIMIPSTIESCPVTSIGDGAFFGCSGLTTITIPDGVTSIGRHAFDGCSGLTSVTIPNSVTNVDYGAFEGCSGLTSITIPEGAHIGSYAFYGCSKLTSVTIPENMTSIGEATFKGCSSLTAITIPDSVTNIDHSAFRDCSRLEAIVIPDGVTNIGQSAFDGCRSLKEVSIPGSVRRIGDDAFVDCFSLTNVIIQSGVETIGVNTFMQCWHLQSITIPDSLRNVGAWAFYRCRLLSEVHISDLAAWCGISFRVRDSADGLCSDNPCYYAHHLYLDGVEITKLVIPDGVTGIGSYAFHGCSELTEATVPISVTGIGNNAFSGCSGLETVYVPASCTGGTPWGLSDTTEIVWYVMASFDATSGSLPEDAQDVVARIGRQYGETDEFPLPYRLGYSFGGWSLYGSIITSNSIVQENTNHVLTAMWTPNDYMVSFDATGGTVDPKSKTVTFNATYGELPVSEHTGYVFLDWRLNDAVIDTETVVTTPRDHTLSARWGISIGGGVWKETICDEPISLGAPLVAPSGEVVVPSEIDGRPVVEIGAEAFTGNTTVTTIALPDSLTSVANGAFSGCVNLRLLRLPLCFLGKTSGMGIPPECTVSYHGYCNLSVSSAFGHPVPETGRHSVEVETPTVISCSVGKIHNAEGSGFRYVCVGWTGMGSVPASGTETNVTFEIEEDSSIAWIWETNVWIECAVTGDAASAGLAAWFVKDGAAAVVPFAATGAPLSWTISGDADGVSVDPDAGLITIPTDRPRSVAVAVTHHTTTNSVETGEPAAWSGVGAAAGWRLAPDGTAADGWSLRSEEIGGSETASVEIALPHAGTLSFDWRVSSAVRKHFACYYVDGTRQNRISGETDWATETVALGDGPHVVRWTYEKSSAAATGDDAAFLDNVDWSPLTFAEALDAEGIEWSTEGGAAWIPVVSISSDGQDAAKSGSLVGEETSRLVATVAGPGMLSWLWKTDVQDLAGVDVYLDSAELDDLYLFDEPDWTAASLAIEGDGPHRIEFRFWNGGTETTVSDCAYIDCVTWDSDYVLVEGVAVPKDWIRTNAAGALAAAGGDYEAAARATAANGADKVWQCYVGGVSPTNAAERLLATVEMVEGAPVVSWTPDLNEGGTKSDRIYTVEGKEKLADPTWGPTNAATRFFRVKVEMP